MSWFRSSTSTDHAPGATERRDLRGWGFLVGVFGGVYVLAPLVGRLVMLATGGSVDLALAVPAALPGASGAVPRRVMSSVPVDALGSGATTSLVWGTAIQLVAAVAFAAVLDQAFRRARPGRHFGRRRQWVCVGVAVAAGLAGFVGGHAVDAAGVLACRDLYSACGDGGGWHSPLDATFLVVAAAVGVVVAFARTESVVREDAEGLV